MEPNPEYSYVGLTAYLRLDDSSDSPLHKGVVVGHRRGVPATRDTPAQPETVTINFEANGRKSEILCSPSRVFIVPKEVPELWREVLKTNKDVPGIEKIGVAFVPYADRDTTTLFHRETGRTLRSRIYTEECASIRLCDAFEGMTFYESKPELLECHSDYLVGDIELAMPEPVRY